jgi:peptide deformylase
MVNLSVVQVGDPVLRRRADEVPEAEITSQPVARLIERMWSTLDAVPGVGLAAPQIGEGRRVVVVHDLPEFIEHYSELQLLERERQMIEPYVLINPVLTAVGYETRTHFEGCLSVEGYTAAVERFHQVDVGYVDPTGRRHHERVAGWHARILQHEVDHLDGTLYVDRMNTRTLCTTDTYSDLAALPTAEAVDTVTGAAGPGEPRPPSVGPGTEPVTPPPRGRAAPA